MTHGGGRSSWLLRAVCAALLAGVALGETDECVECHSDPVYAEDGTPFFTVESYRAGVHGALECTECHRRAANAFDSVPHEASADELTKCILCHGRNLREYNAEFRKSVHAERIEGFACGDCHDAHTMPATWPETGTPERTELANGSCLRCHRDADFRIAAKHAGEEPPSTTHDWLPRLDKHARMRCIVCHTPIEGENDHEVLGKQLAARSCESCHEENAALIEKYVGKDDRRSWVTNPILFDDVYMPGTIRNRLVDGIILALFALAILGALGHGVLRILARPRHAGPAFVVETTFLYPRGLRLWHWTNAVLVILLAATGLRLHFGGREDPILSFETAFHVHNLAGAILVFVGVFYFIQNARSGNQRQYFGRPQGGIAGVRKQARFYLYGIFRGEPHPYHASPERKFNPLQQLTYAGVMYVVFPILIVSGIVLLYPNVLPAKIGGKPGGWWFATAHYLAAAAMIVFLLVHLYLATMGDRVSYLISAMITGRHKHHVPVKRGAEREKEE